MCTELERSDRQRPPLTAHHQPLASFLREPQVVSIGAITGATGTAVMPSVVHTQGPTPHAALHPPTDHVWTAAIGPPPPLLAKVTHAGGVETITLVLIVVLLLAGRAYVCILDKRRRVLAHAG